MTKLKKNYFYAKNKLIIEKKIKNLMQNNFLILRIANILNFNLDKKIIYPKITQLIKKK